MLFDTTARYQETDFSKDNARAVAWKKEIPVDV